jgi:hypothetical protein
MRVRRVEISHFRGIKSLTWSIAADQHFVALIGPGDATKTTILTAVQRELGDSAEDLEEHAPNRSGGVDALVEHHQVHPGRLQIVRQLDQVLEGTAEPVELGDDQLIPRLQHAQRLVELGTPGELPRRGVSEDPLAATASAWASEC